MKKIILSAILIIQGTFAVAQKGPENYYESGGPEKLTYVSIRCQFNAGSKTNNPGENAKLGSESEYEIEVTENQIYIKELVLIVDGTKNFKILRAILNREKLGSKISLPKSTKDLSFAAEYGPNIFFDKLQITNGYIESKGLTAKKKGTLSIKAIDPKSGTSYNASVDFNCSEGF